MQQLFSITEETGAAKRHGKSSGYPAGKDNE